MKYLLLGGLLLHLSTSSESTAQHLAADHNNPCD